MNRQIAGIGIALVSGLAGCRSCPCPPAAGAPPARMAAAESPQVFIEMTCARVPEAEVATLPAGAASYSTVLLDAGRKDAILARWAKDKTVAIVNAPRILALAAQRASVFVGEEFTPSAGAPGAAPLRFVAPDDDPNRAWVGTSIFVTPTVGSGAVDLDLDATWSEARHPGAKDVADLDIRRARVARRLRVTPEQTALVVADGALERDGKSYRMVLLVGARALATERSETAAPTSLRAESRGRTFESTDGGATWTWAGSLTDNAEMTITGASGRRLFASDHRGLYESRDEGKSWTRVGDAEDIRAHPWMLLDQR